MTNQLRSEEHAELSKTRVHVIKMNANRYVERFR